MENLKKLKNILLNYRILYYENNKLIHFDNSKTNARIKIIKKYLKRKEIVKLTRIEISFHRGKKFYQGGLVQIQIKQYQVKNDKISLVCSEGDTGSIWIDKKYLIKNKFKNKKEVLKLLLKLLKNINKNKKLKNMSINKIQYLT